MGCGKSKHDVAAGNTITRKKSDVGSNKSNYKDLEPTVNASILEEQKEKQIPSQESSKELVAGVRDVNVMIVAGVQDGNVEAVASEQDANVEAVASEQDANVEAVAVVQDANVEGVASEQDANVEAVAVVQDANVEAVAVVQDANVEVVAVVQDIANEKEELKGGGKDVEIKEESVVEKQEPGKLISEESSDNVSDGKSEKESLSNESAKLDDDAKETLVEKETKQEAENEEPQAMKQENADEEPEAANPITAELEVASPTTN
ncbi:uncharacterized protein LOC7481644 isoform X2 [Populus trichocarpa]|uniref:uncharacterized protein LOC7481644 isoform X2 n=1 Tax=Populus trichocarpa TaxID=3694 RepID=UPI0022777571|nr:uncharacterized protein LOC7481644 isoform X2 [Populus trichocarpa]